MITMATTSVPLSAATFARYRALVYDLSGIALGESKEGLVRARVGKRMRALGLEDHDAYLDLLLADATGDEIPRFLDAISTNVTSFFREAAHFDLLARVSRYWVAPKIWSAACSTGEEAWSIAMTVPGARVLATDLSTRVLERARAGVYSADRLGALGAERRREHFRARPRERSFEVATDLRSSVVFARLNLIEIPYPMSGPFDAVFCRNVMIYFDADVRRRVLAEILRLLRPGGYLFVGLAESLGGLARGLRSVEPSVYVKEGA